MFHNKVISDYYVDSSVYRRSCRLVHLQPNFVSPVKIQINRFYH